MTLSHDDSTINIILCIIIIIIIIIITTPCFCCCTTLGNQKSKFVINYKWHNLKIVQYVIQMRYYMSYG